MKKLIYVITILSMLITVSCSKDKSEEFVFDKTIGNIDEIANVLSGKFVGEKEDILTKTYEITFNPYSSPKIEKWTYNGVTERVKIFGECEVRYYYNINSSSTAISEHWRYSVQATFSEKPYRLVFYPELVGRTEMHDITIINTSAFVYDGVYFKKANP